jgi:hypothetical protein
MNTFPFYKVDLIVEVNLFIELKAILFTASIPIFAVISNFYTSTLIRKQSQKIKSLQVEYQLKDTIQLYFLTKNNKFKKNQKMIKEKLKSHSR